MELDLLYVDLMLRRYAEVAGGPVTLESTGETLEERRARRAGGTPHRLASGFSEVWGSLAGKVRIEDGLGLEHGAGHADEAIGD